jgi:hypothetical protein
MARLPKNDLRESQELESLSGGAQGQSGLPHLPEMVVIEPRYRSPTAVRITTLKKWNKESRPIFQFNVAYP